MPEDETGSFCDGTAESRRLSGDCDEQMDRTGNQDVFHVDAEVLQPLGEFRSLTSQYVAFGCNNQCRGQFRQSLVVGLGR